MLSIQIPASLTKNSYEIENAIQTLANFDEVAFSKCSAEAQSVANDFFTAFIQKIEETTGKAKLLENITKSIVFVKNVSNADKLFIHPAKTLESGDIELFPPKEDGSITVDEILLADLLVIAPLSFSYDKENVTEKSEVKVKILSKNPNKPEKIMFWSGGTYFLTAGYSVKNCMYLHRTVTIDHPPITIPGALDIVKVEQEHAAVAMIEE